MKIATLLLLLLPIIATAQNDEKLMSKKGMDVTKHVPKGIAVGENAPIIAGYSLDGKKINSIDILKEKQIVLIFKHIKNNCKTG